MAGVIGAYHLGSQKKKVKHPFSRNKIGILLTVPHRNTILFEEYFLPGTDWIAVRGRNMIFMLMSIEIMFNAADLVFIIAGTH